MTSFSVVQNSKYLFSTQQNPKEIQAVHSIRFVSAILIYISHKAADHFSPIANRTELSIVSATSESVFGRICALYTDTFLMISGMLLTYSFIGRLQRGQKIRIFHEIAARYLRIVPPLLALILITIYVIPLLGSGPLWGVAVTRVSSICKQHWWRNLLFIQNWFGFENMCLLHTHHVGTDFELFLIAPFLIILLFKQPKKGMTLIVGLAIASTIARFYTTFTKELAYFVPFGVKLKQLVDTGDLMYSIPPYRYTVYAIGIVLGYYLRKLKDFQLNKLQLALGWSICIGSHLAVNISGAAMTGMDYKYNATHAALFAAFAPILWCLNSAWIIFASHLGFTSNVNFHLMKFLDVKSESVSLDIITKTMQWKGFIVTSRFTYAFYLVQIPVLQLKIATTRITSQYGYHSIVS